MVRSLPSYCPQAGASNAGPVTPANAKCPSGTAKIAEGIIGDMAASAQTKIVEAAAARASDDGAPEAQEKLRTLESRLEQLGGLMVAYSGGVDSAFLAATAHRVLGSRMLAVLADSPSLARRDMEQATAFAQSIGMPLQLVATGELDREEYARNDANRCFHCKDELFQVMEKLGAKLGFANIAYGMNADDTRDFRPGQRAAEQHTVLAPLAEAGWKCARWPRRPATPYGIARRRRACLHAWSMDAP